MAGTVPAQARIDTLQIEARRFKNTAMSRFRRHRLAMVGLVVVALFSMAAVFAPWVAGQDPYLVDMNSIRKPPSAGHILGTDSAGRDVWARMIYGARVSMSVGLIAMSIACTIGTTLGMVSGYMGGRVDNVIMRFVELVMTFPTFFAIILMVSLLGPNIFNVMVVIGVLGWTGLSRLVRGQVLSLRNYAFVEAARCLGASHRRIVFIHMLPNVLPYVLVAGTLGMAGAVLTEASLSFLGLGVQIPMSSWGTMINSALSLIVLQRQPWLWLPPGIAISLAVLCVNFVGDGLRDAFDPRMSL